MSAYTLPDHLPYGGGHHHLLWRRLIATAYITCSITGTADLVLLAPAPGLSVRFGFLTASRQASRSLRRCPGMARWKGPSFRGRLLEPRLRGHPLASRRPRGQ